jgi:excisionase family DNA binding protein
MSAESSFESYIAPSTIAHDLDVPIAAVRRWIQRGDLPTVQIDRAVRIPRRDYERWLRGNTKSGPA